jgi:phenylalanyl-tRNA synthetase beta chain
MLVPVSWLREFVDIDIPVELLAERLTLAGLEVSRIEYLGVPQRMVEGVRWPVSDHLVWDRQKLVLGAIREVKSHPNADRLVLALVDYGGGQPEQCVTGAPNLFEYKDQGPLDSPLWTGFAAEGAEVWDGHSDTPRRMILKEKPLRGIPNRSMVCSEKELGISDEHEGVIILFDQPLNQVTRQPAQPGTPLQDVLGDVLLDIELTPNLARCFSILGVAREVAALLDKPLRQPGYDCLAQGAPIAGEVRIDIRTPELNPRFTLALLRDTQVRPSPEWMQRRLRLVGQRPINNIVDVTNYITFEIGQPLHAFDFDKLKARVGGAAPVIITRLPQPGETLQTLDEAQRQLQDFNILVCDEAGVLSLGGIIGGAETEIDADTRNVLLEAANWNFINIRRTMQAQKVHTDAGTRFSRGVHPSQAILGVQRGIELMRQTGGGHIAQGILDAYPLPPAAVQVALGTGEIRRILGIDFTTQQAADLLRRLAFDVTIADDVLHVTVPDHRMDISDEPVTGQADLIEEIARIYGYDRIPNTIIADEMPPQRSDKLLEREEAVRDILVALGLREQINYRLTTPEREALLTNGGDAGYVTLANPISADRTALRHTLLAGLLETAHANARYASRQQVFEIGSVYLKQPGDLLPAEPVRLGILLTGARRPVDWTGADDSGLVDFYDLKGVVETLLHRLHVSGEVRFVRASHPAFHPGRAAALEIEGQATGTFGELHPRVAQAFELTAAPVIAGEFDLQSLLQQVDEMHRLTPLPQTPPVYQDIALVVTGDTPAEAVAACITRAGGDLLRAVRLFDVYTGGSIPEGHKSLAYNLTYQADDRTLTDKEVAKVHQRIVRTAERELGARLRA